MTVDETMGYELRNDPVARRIAAAGEERRRRRCPAFALGAPGDETTGRICLVGPKREYGRRESAPKPTWDANPGCVG